MKVSKTRRRKVDLRPLAYETDIVKDKDYLLHLPNGETVHVYYNDNNGPMLSITPWPGESKTYIRVRNQHTYSDAEEMR